MIERFFLGFGFVFRGRKLLREVPKLKRWVVIPFLLDAILFFTGLYFASDLIRTVVYKATFLIFDGAEGFLYNLMYYPLLILFWIAFVVMYFYLVYIIASILASPFYSIIAERTLAHLGDNSIANRSFMESIRLAVKMFMTSLARGIVLLCFGVALFVASFVPGLNLIAGFCVFVIIAFDTLDYSFEAKGLTLQQRLSFLKANLPELCGMGAFVGLTVIVPGLILLVTPFAVIGAAEQLTKMQLLKK